MSPSDDAPITFDGSNWQDLTRLVTTAQLKFLTTADTEDDPYDKHPAKCAYLASHFTGPALDWLGGVMAQEPGWGANFDTFVVNVRNQFGVSDDGLRAQRRGQLEALAWQSDLPVFFAEFDRLTSLLGLTGNPTKIALVRSKLPHKIQVLLAEQALDFHDYATMRERLITMWNLDPSHRSLTVPAPATNKRPRCGRCGKKGHTASECRAKK